MISEKELDKLEGLLAKVETQLWRMAQKLPFVLRKTFREEVRDKMYDYSNTIVLRSEKYMKKTND